MEVHHFTQFMLRLLQHVSELSRRSRQHAYITADTSRSCFRSLSYRFHHLMHALACYMVMCTRHLVIALSTKLLISGAHPSLFGCTVSRALFTLYAYIGKYLHRPHIDIFFIYSLVTTLISGKSTGRTFCHASISPYESR